MSFRGIITPFHEDGSIDRDGFLAMMEHLIGAGVHGIIIDGTTGEHYPRRARRTPEAGGNNCQEANSADSQC
jgi:hypothetical protein